MSVQAVWRIALDAPLFKADDLSGEGAKKSGGRWNKKGPPFYIPPSPSHLLVWKLWCISMPKVFP
jgi:RES domain-containing protein